MSTPSPSAPGSNAPAKAKPGPADVLKVVDEISKWHGRWTTVAWLVTTIAPIVAAVLVWLADTTVSYIHVLGKTAPLTVAVMLLVPIFRQVKTHPLGYALLTILVLAAAAFL